ncbi:ABC transporter permease [Candidatus Bathyarchaeota archaeon]|nr:ABC transporter permease [Candidatus Bathyarchaeota archaeon]
MLRDLKAIISKEVKELIRDPRILLGMIIVPLIMFPIMGFAMQSIFTQVQESVKQVTVGVADLDNGNWSQALIENLIGLGANVTVINASDESQAVQQMQIYNLTDLIVIPKGFSQNVTEGEKAQLKTYSVYSGSGMVESARSEAVNSMIEMVKRLWAPDPFTVSKNSVVKGKPLPIPPEVLFNLAMSQYVATPIALSIIIVLAMQLAATSVASEKEEKTLETLLSLPINRFTILMGKLFGSIFVALLGAVAYLIGFTYYMGEMFTFVPTEVGVDLAELGLAPSLLGYVLMGISLFVSLLSALALAVVISAFTEDVRSAQAIVGYIYPLIFIPMFLLMYTDVFSLSLPLQILILAIPYSHPILAARAAVTGNYLMAIGGIVYVSIFTVVILYVAAKFFATEKILTARIKFRKLRKLKRKTV